MKLMFLTLALIVLSANAGPSLRDELRSFEGALRVFQEDGEDNLPENCSMAITNFQEALDNVNENCTLGLGDNDGGFGFKNGRGGFFGKMKMKYGNEARSTRGFNFTDEEIQEGCDDFNELCSEDVANLNVAASELFQTCRNVDRDNFIDTIRAFPFQEFIQAQRAISVGLAAQFTCLEVDGELCVLTLRDAAETARERFDELDCDNQFSRKSDQNCTDECTEVAETYVDEAGCCFAAYFSALPQVTDGRMEKRGSGRFKIEPQVCGIDLDLCEEATELLDSIGVDVDGLTVPGASAASQIAGVGLSLAAVALAAMTLA